MYYTVCSSRDVRAGVSGALPLALAVAVAVCSIGDVRALPLAVALAIAPTLVVAV